MPASKASTGGTDIAPSEPSAERYDYGQLVLAQRLRDALARLNPALLLAKALDDAFRNPTRPEGAELNRRIRAFVPKAQEDWN